MSTTNRRDFLKITATVSGTALVGPPALGQTTLPGSKKPTGHSFQLNGAQVESQRPAKTPLAQVLREELRQTGTKTFCESGVCGACTVHIDGVARHSCMVPIYKVTGQDVQTIEGLSQKHLHEVQQAFIDADALQCGFCTPGMVMAAAAFIRDYKKEVPGTMPSRERIEVAMSGNLCRCGAQPKIFNAIENCFRATAQPPPIEGVPRQDAYEKVTGGPNTLLIIFLRMSYSFLF